MDKDKNTVTPEQMFVIKFVVKHARELQQLHPEIAIDYRAGLTHLEIAQKYDIVSLFNSRDAGISEGIVGRALRGNLESQFGEVYGGLIERDDYEQISREHQVKNGVANALNLKITGRGIFALTPKERAQAASLGGKKLYVDKIGMFSRTPEEVSADAKKAAQRCYELGRGVHAMTSEQRTAAGKKAGKIGGKLGAKRQKELGIGLYGLTHAERVKNARNNVIQRGQIPWERHEIDYVLSLLASGDYKYKGRNHVKKMAEEVNRNCHDGKEIRTGNAVSEIIKKIRKGRKK